MGATFINPDLLENLEGSDPVDTGQCVALVKDLLKKQYPDAPKDHFVTSYWKAGTKVMAYGSADKIKKGTPIATFDERGVYPNCGHGNHAAIFLEFSGTGFKILEQNAGPKISSRLIRNKKSNDGDFPACSEMKELGKDVPSNDADWYYVIEIDGI